MAKQLISLCDRCGEAGEDVRTYTVRLDGTAWEMDLDDRHADEVTITEFMKTGRALDAGIRRSGGLSGLDRRVRGVPLDHPSE